MDRRNFLEKSAVLLGSMAIPGFGSPVPVEIHNFKKSKTTDELVTDEAFWDAMRLHYNQPQKYMNLENGYFSPMALPVLAKHNGYNSDINTRTSWFMRKEQNEAIENARTQLSGFLGCNSEELALTRNTTESLNIVIGGYSWNKGDEVVIGNQDYGSMAAAFKQAEKRFGIVVKTAQVPLLPKNDEEIADAYIKLIGPRTRMIHLTHLINITGQVIPVSQIATEARKRGVDVVVDCAHSIAQINFKLPDLNADYIGASLHKWFGNALGTGFLWVKKDKISKIWPLMADTDYSADNIRKFEHQGTRPIQSLRTIKAAIDFHEIPGSELKEKRLKYLMIHWCSEVASTSGINILTPWNIENRNSAIATVAVNGYTPQALSEKLLKDYNIFVVAIDHPIIKGVRVTPHLFTKPADVKTFARALNEIAGK